MILVSRYDSVCGECRREIRVGDKIVWTAAGVPIVHMMCSEEGRKRAAAIESSRLTNADVAIPKPDGLEYLPFQKAGIAYARGKRGVLIADEMGLGKTIQAIGIINDDETIQTALIVCQASLKSNWRRELSKWLVRDVQWDIINYEQLHKLPTEKYWDILILDEAHYIKDDKSKRAKAVLNVSKRCRRRAALTGTPIQNRPLELFPILRVVAPEVWDPAGYVKGKKLEAGDGAGFFRFAKRYCNAHQKVIGYDHKKRQPKYAWVFDGASNLEELQDRLRETCMVRRLKAEVLHELPAKIRQIIRVDGNEKLIEQERIRWEQLGMTPEQALAAPDDVAFGDIARIRHELALFKVSAVIDFVDSILEQQDKLIIFAHHKDVAEALTEGLLGYNPVCMTGDTPPEDRQGIVEAFQEDQTVGIFIGTIGVAGVGHTLTAASTVCFVEESWRPSDVSQAEDRAHRIGQKDSVQVLHFVNDGSLDAMMVEYVIRKQQIADVALDIVIEPKKEDDIMSRPVVLPPKDARAKALEDFGLTEEDVSRIHADLKYLASLCDGARELDGQGFNANDTYIGHQFSREIKLSPKQAKFAQGMLKKYARQLGRR